MFFKKPLLLLFINNLLVFSVSPAHVPPNSFSVHKCIAVAGLATTTLCNRMLHDREIAELSEDSNKKNKKAPSLVLTGGKYAAAMIAVGHTAACINHGAFLGAWYIFSRAGVVSMGIHTAKNISQNKPWHAYTNELLVDDIVKRPLLVIWGGLTICGIQVFSLFVNRS